MKIKRVEHIALAVNDMSGMLAFFQDALGLPLDYIEEIAHTQTRLAMLPVGETFIELVEGMAPESVTSKWIAEHGPGLFHICLEVDDIVSALAELKLKGVKLQHETPIVGHGNSRIAFLDPASTGGTLIELVELPVAQEGHGMGNHEAVG